MVKRIAVLFPDGSINIMSNQVGEVTAITAARRECQIWNKSRRTGELLTQFGEIEIDLMSFRERF